MLDGVVGGVADGVLAGGVMLGVIGTVDEGTVLGPAVGGALSLHPARRSTATVVTAAPGKIFIDAILTRRCQRFSQLALS